MSVFEEASSFAVRTERKSCSKCEELDLFCCSEGFCFCDIKPENGKVEDCSDDLTYLDKAVMKYGTEFMTTYAKSVSSRKFANMLISDDTFKKIFSDPERIFFFLYYSWFKEEFDFFDCIYDLAPTTRKGTMILLSLGFGSKVVRVASANDFDLFDHLEIPDSELIDAMGYIQSNEFDLLVAEVIKTKDLSELKHPFLIRCSKRSSSWTELTNYVFSHYPKLTQNSFTF